MNMVTAEELKAIFEKANSAFRNDHENDKLFDYKAGEMTFCGALMLKLESALRDTPYSDYSVDIEYHKSGGDLKELYPKEGDRAKKGYVRIDLVVHRRGVNTDNLIALEMKKSYQSRSSKDDDRERVEILTIPIGDKVALDVGKNKGEIFKGEFGYVLGVYYEIDMDTGEVSIEYYHRGQFWEYASNSSAR